MTVLYGLGILATLLVAFFVLERKKEKKVVVKTPEHKEGYFQGLNLEEWMYLGNQELKVEHMVVVVHLFCRWDDHDKRAYRIQGSEPVRKSVEDYHYYMHKYLQPWYMGNEEIYQYNSSPSKHLKSYMLQNYQCLWSTEIGWWAPVQSEEEMAKTPRAKKSKKVKEPTTDSNVVQVDFGNKNRDE